jgi:hypothetical protein
MRSYLEIALRVATVAQPEPSEPRPDARASAERMTNQSHPPPADVVAKPQAAPNELAPCGSSDCAGCYCVGDGKRIHPPKCGDEYRKWLELWKPEGKVQ